MQWSPEDSLVVFSKIERLAIGVLLVLILLGSTSGYWLPQFWPMEVKSMDDRIAFQAEIGEWEVRNQRLIDSLAGVKAARDQRYADNREKWNRPRRNTSPSKRTWPTRKAETVSIDYSIPMPALESVDANTVDTNVLFRMGVPPKIARRWVKFRERGGNFVRKEDIGKLYGMPDSTLNRILPYLKTPDLKEKRVFPKKKPVIVDVNSSSSEELQEVRGIGAYSAERIIEYRKKLGGFISLAQVAETPGLRDSTFLKVKDQLTIVQQEPRLIRINQFSKDQLAKHPYISWKQAEIIILNRRNHGNYRSREDLLATIVLDTATVDRLMPYLDFVD
jgi:competence ComEA-like helix-hairpin-helix protein